MATILGEKKVYLTVGKTCYSYVSENGKTSKVEETALECCHEEADSRIVFHLNKCKNNSKVLIKASDTDVLIILLDNILKFGFFHLAISQLKIIVLIAQI